MTKRREIQTMIKGMAGIFAAVMILAFGMGNTVRAAGTDTADIPGIESGEEVFQEFLENTEYVQELEYYKTKYSKLNESDKWKQEFLEFVGDNNTEEEWNNMSSYDILVYFETYLKPYMGMVNNTYSSEDEYVEDTTLIKLFRKQENGEAFADALEKVIRWQYRYFEQTGTLYNFFAEEGEESAPLNRTETDGNGLTAEESKELAGLREELLEGEDAREVLGEEPETESENGNVLVIVLVVLVIAVAALGIGVFCVKRKSNDVEE